MQTHSSEDLSQPEEQGEPLPEDTRDFASPKQDEQKVPEEKTNETVRDPQQWEQEYLERVEKENQENLRREKEEEEMLREKEASLSPEREGRSRKPATENKTFGVEETKDVQSEEHVAADRRQEQECMKEDYAITENKGRDSANSEVRSSLLTE